MNHRLQLLRWGTLWNPLPEGSLRDGRAVPSLSPHLWGLHCGGTQQLHQLWQRCRTHIPIALYDQRNWWGCIINGVLDIADSCMLASFEATQVALHPGALFKAHLSRCDWNISEIVLFPQLHMDQAKAHLCQPPPINPLKANESN